MFLDESDLVIRKGATCAHEDERLVVPNNMGEGSIILRGTGNEAWNRSAPHGAGRDGSRRWAKETFSLNEFETAMEGVYSTSVSEDTLDKSPMSSKDSDVVESCIGETGEIIDRLHPGDQLQGRLVDNGTMSLYDGGDTDDRTDRDRTTASSGQPRP